MTLEDSYDDFIAVIPQGNIQYFKKKLRISSLTEMTQIFAQITINEMKNYFYNYNYEYKYKIDELILAIKDELLYRRAVHKENRSGLSVKAPEYIPLHNPIYYTENNFPPLRSIQYN
jgi:hypothetical protein